MEIKLKRTVIPVRSPLHVKINEPIGSNMRLFAYYCLNLVLQMKVEFYSTVTE